MRTRVIYIIGFLICFGALLGYAEEAPPQHDCQPCADTGKIECSHCKADRNFWCSDCPPAMQCKHCLGIGWTLCTACGGKDAAAEHEHLLSLRTEQERIGSIVGTKLRSIETQKFRLITDIDHEKSHQVAHLLEQYCDRFNRAFGAERGEKLWEGRCDIYLFQPRKAFIKFASSVDDRPEVAASGGYSSPSPNRPIVVLFSESRSDDETTRTIIHELAHVYLDLHYKVAPIPLWVHEGVAQHFEFTYKPDTSRRAELLLLAKNAQRSRMLMSLTELAEMRIVHGELLPYAASWTAIDFLMKADPKAFYEWIRLMKDGNDQYTAFEKAYGGTLASYDRPWRAHLRRQR